MAVYVGRALKVAKHLKADDLLTFALWCAATVTGVFAFVAAFPLSKQQGEETNGLYVGIFGLCLTWLSAQRAVAMVRGLFPKSTTRIHDSSDLGRTTSDEPPKTG